jgi:hypothetical protein
MIPNFLQSFLNSNGVITLGFLRRIICLISMIFSTALYLVNFTATSSHDGRFVNNRRIIAGDPGIVHSDVKRATRRFGGEYGLADTTVVFLMWKSAGLIVGVSEHQRCHASRPELVFVIPLLWSPQPMKLTRNSHRNLLP